MIKMDNNMIEVGKLDTRNSRFTIKFESPLELADAVDAIAAHYRKHYESRHDGTASIQRYGPFGDQLEAQIRYLGARSDRPVLALRVAARGSHDASFSVDILPGSLLPDSIDFHSNIWQDCYNRNWWKKEYHGN